MPQLSRDFHGVSYPSVLHYDVWIEGHIKSVSMCYGGVRAASGVVVRKASVLCGLL